MGEAISAINKFEVVEGPSTERTSLSKNERRILDCRFFLPLKTKLWSRDLEMAFIEGKKGDVFLRRAYPCKCLISPGES
jgi:hypothetical protein